MGAAPQPDKGSRAIESLRRQVQDLKHANAQLTGILESVSESFIAVDREWRILFANKRVLEKTVRKLDDVIGKNLWELEPAAKESEFYVQYQRVMRDGVPAHFEMQYAPNNAWYEVHVYPNEQGLVAHILDITDRKRSQIEMAAHEAVRLSDEILNQMAEAILLTDLNGTIRKWMGSAAQIFGYSPEEGEGKSAGFLYRTDVRDDLVKRMLSQIERTGSFSEEIPCIRKDGVEIYAETSAKAIKDNAGVPLFLIVVHRDVTGRKRMEERLKRSEALLAEAQQIGEIGSWEWDIRSNEVTWSDQLYRAYGVEPPTFGASYEAFLNYLHPADVLAFSRVMEVCLEKRLPFSFDHRIVRPDGEVRFMHARGEVLCDEAGTPVRMAGTGQDITARKQIEDEIRRLNADLETRVAQRTADLQRSNDDLEQFAYISSHDLKEPLRTITAFTQLLAQRYRHVLDDEGREFINLIVDGALRMSDLIGDLLSFSRTSGQNGTGAVPASMESALRAAVSNLRRSIDETGTLIVNGELPEVQGDETQLSLLLQNLISNAIKYRSADAPVIEISAEGQDGFWRFCVRDNGIGIDPAYHERVFGLFKRLHGRDVPGTGLGLAICKRLVERHGGRIWVHSTLGQGAAFYFTLPRDLTICLPT